MKILLEELQHQTDALEAIIDNFKGVKQEYGKIENPYANVLVNEAYDDKTNIDIKTSRKNDILNMFLFFINNHPF